MEKKCEQDRHRLDNISKCRHRHSDEKVVEELLEKIWNLQELDKNRKSCLEKDGNNEELLKELENLIQEKLVVLKDDIIDFTEEGKASARDIVRRHRLAERMLNDLFDINKEKMEAQSCEFEHILSEEVTDSICAFLGHPTTCPHGRPIPPGECCKNSGTVLRPLIVPLSGLMPGEKGRITFIANKDKHCLQRISSLGIVPDSIVQLIQKLPVMVIQVDHTEIALDSSIISDIYVKRVGN
ncbi:MAG: metal-dependent transcriptional regulator [Vulcanimicrobiota bacterium]